MLLLLSLPPADGYTDVCGGLNVYSVESKHRYSCSGLLTHESGWSFVGQTTRNSHIIKCTLDSTLFAWQINDYWLYKSCVHNVMVAHWDQQKSCSASVILGLVMWVCVTWLPGDNNQQTTATLLSSCLFCLMFMFFVYGQLIFHKPLFCQNSGVHFVLSKLHVK